MYNFSQIPNGYLPLNIDLSSSQPINFSSYVSKPEISNRMPQMYHHDAQPYANIQSLLTKRSPTVELNNPPTKVLHQDNLMYQTEAFRMQELNKAHGNSSKASEEMNPQKLLMRSQQELFNLQKNQALAGQQFPGYGNAMSLQNIDLTQAEAQGFGGENPSLALIKQFLESSKGMNNRDYGMQLQQQLNEPMQKYMANMYNLQNGFQTNASLQNLASLGNLGSLGNLAGLGSLGNLGGLANLNLNQLSNLGNFGNLANLNSLGNLNNPMMMELLNQARNQQLNQQLIQQLQQPLNNMQSLPYLQEVLKSDPSLRNLSMNDLMLLNSSLTAPQSFSSILNQIPNVNMQTQGLQQQTASPSSIGGKSTAQTLVLQRPEPQRQENGLRRENGLARQSSQGIHNSIEINEEGKVKPVVLVKPDNKVKRDQMEKMMRPQEKESKEVRTTREEREIVKPSEMKVKKIEIHNNIMIHQSGMQDTPWDNNRDAILERRKSRPLQLQPDSIEKTPVENMMKKSTTPNERAQKPQFFGTPESEKQRQSHTPQANKTKIIDGINGRDGLLNGHAHKSENKMIIEREERKTNTIKFSHGEFLNRNKGNMEVEKNRTINNEPSSRQIPIGSLMSSMNRGQTLMGNLAENQYKGAELGESIMKPEREQDTGVQKIILTKRGPQYQTEIPELILNDEDEEELVGRRRNIKPVWDPYGAHQKDLANYQKNLQRILATKVVNQEKALKLLTKMEMDFDKALDVVRKNERRYSNFLGISNCTRELRSRRPIE